MSVAFKKFWKAHVAVSNMDWITVNGRHIPVAPGQSKGDAVETALKPTPKRLGQSFKDNTVAQLKHEGDKALADKIDSLDLSSVKSFEDIHEAVKKLGVENNASVKNWLKTVKMLFEANKS